MVARHGLRRESRAARVRSDAQRGFSFRSWGGARKGAGRPPKGEKPGVSHLRRPSLSPRHPVHVTLSVKRGLASLRSPALFPIVRAALAAGRERFGFRLVHFSVQRDHLHLIAEAARSLALSRGVQGLSIRLARGLNRALQRTGKLFADRYHARHLETPRQVRFALRYVLANARKHERAAPAPGFVDVCSSAPWFRAFSRPAELAFDAEQARRAWLEASGTSTPPVVLPQTWLLRRGYERAGPIDVDDGPRNRKRSRLSRT